MENNYSDINIYLFAEYVYPAAVYIDHFGTKYQFRKYIYMENLGIIDATSKKIILSAKPEYQKITINPYHEAIIAGSNFGNNMGWEAFSFSGTPLFSGERFKTLDEVYERLRERTKTWK